MPSFFLSTIIIKKAKDKIYILMSVIIEFSLYLYSQYWRYALVSKEAYAYSVMSFVVRIFACLFFYKFKIIFKIVSHGRELYGSNSKRIFWAIIEHILDLRDILLMNLCIY